MHGRFLVAVLLGVLLAASGAAGTTPIHVDTEPGGDVDTGTRDQWDGQFENTNGAMFWNGSAWVTNNTAAHSYFTDLRTGQRIKEYTVTVVDSTATLLGSIARHAGRVHRDEAALRLRAASGGWRRSVRLPGCRVRDGSARRHEGPSAVAGHRQRHRPGTLRRLHRGWSRQHHGDARRPRVVPARRHDRRPGSGPEPGPQRNQGPR